jgi:hypothetical protein
MSPWGNACWIGEVGREGREALLNTSRSAFFVTGLNCFLQNVMFYQFLVQQGPRSFRSDVTVELLPLFWNSARDRNVVSWRLLSSCLLVLKEWKKSDSTNVAYEFRPGPSEGTYLLTYSTEQSPSWETDRFSASQEIPHILLNPNVHYRIHRCQPPVHNLSQIDPVHTPTSHFLKIHLNFILPSMPGSPKWSLSPRFPLQNPVYASPLPHTHYIPNPSHSFRFYHPNSIGWAVQKELWVLKCYSMLTALQVSQFATLLLLTDGTLVSS